MRDGWILSRSTRCTLQNAIEHCVWGLRVALGRVRRKPATARISSERDVMQIGVAGLFLGGRVEPGSGFCFGSGVL